MVLNSGDGEPGVLEDSGDLAVTLRRLHNRLKAEALSEQGRVDYTGLRGGPLHEELNHTSALLRSADPFSLAGTERSAFWINLYNVLSVHGVLALEIRESVMEVPAFFGLVAYDVGGHAYTLDDIENGVLRNNSKHPAKKKRPFAEGDPRLAACVALVDPRIHTALVCASTGCPPVAFYDAKHLDTQLDLAAINYVASDVRVDRAKGRLHLPITLHYYKEDFEPFGDFLLRYAEGAHRDAIADALAKGFRVVFDRYDWSLNQVAESSRE